LIEYTSAVVPGRTRSAALRETTLPIVRSARCSVSVSVWRLSAVIVTPGVDDTAYPATSTVTTYVSGASETNAKWPPLSVVTAAFCDALVTLTRTPERALPVL
jgi:hypothetical protein